MNRRNFITKSGVGAAVAAATVLTKNSLESSLVETRLEAAQAARPAAVRTRPVLVKLGGGGNPYDENSLMNIIRFGVNDITASVRIDQPGRLYGTVDEFAKMRELPDKLGIKIHQLSPPQLSSSHIDREQNPYIMLGKSPERDREIEGFQMMIRNAGAAGIPIIKYNMSLLGVLLQH